MFFECHISDSNIGILEASILHRKGGDIELEITLVPKVVTYKISRWFALKLQVPLLAINWIDQTFTSQTLQTIISIYKGVILLIVF